MGKNKSLKRKKEIIENSKNENEPEVPPAKRFAEDPVPVQVCN